MVTRTGYVGVGNIGMPIAVNVLKGGFDLMVYDINEAPLKEIAALGARIADSPKAVAEHAEVVEVSVPEDAPVEAVVLGADGLLSGARPGSTIVIHSTIHPDTVRKIAREATQKGVDVLDAGVGGGALGARAQTLYYMVGGDAEALERCRPVLATSAKHIFHMGGAGMGVTAKLAEQVMTVLTIQAVAEGFRLAESAGLPLEVFNEVVQVGGPQSRIAANWLRQWSRGVSPKEVDGFHIGLTPALRLGHEVGATLTATALAQQLLPDFLGAKSGASS